MIKGKKGKVEDLKSVKEDSDDFKINLSVEIGGRLIEEDLDEALSIPTINKLSPTMLGDMMAEIPAIHARWNFLYNEAVYEYDMQKIKLDLWLSKKANEIRKQLAQTEKGRITDKMVDEAIKLDPEYEKENSKVAMAKKTMNHVKALAMGFGEKGEKVVNIASMIKWEGTNLSGGKRTNKRKLDEEKGDNSMHNDPKDNGGWGS